MSMTTTLDGRVSGRLHILRGDYMTNDGQINDLAGKTMHVIVDDQGKAWPYLYADTVYNADDFGDTAPLGAERWGDGDRLGRNFSPDAGEFERCGIKFELCGSAVG